MCLLITLVGVDPDHPSIVASNRDERRDRPSAPPGLFVGQKRRILSPRDREAGGTWI
ncbi:MAG: NRDE family protein, partial [Planctomycetota bacterium]